MARFLRKRVGRVVRKAGRYAYKKTGLKNPIKKGRLSSARLYKNASKIAQIGAEVAVLRGMMNAEKKRWLNGVNNTAVGQVNGNTSGAYTSDITPVMSQGVTYNTRNGSSIKWTSAYLQLQFIHQAATQSTIKGSIYIIKVKNAIIPSATLLSNFFNPSPFITSTTIYDDNCTRNQDYFKDFVVLKRKKFYVACDKISGQPNQTTIKMPLKLGHHVKFSGDTNTLTDGQVWMLIVTDNGNMNSATASSVGNISNTAVNTGLNLCWNIVDYYVDN